ncbi:MAG: 3,4-dihydroxy-2-butanone-4-phosphate synthase [Burkholderiales bacterium]|nr:3,4-dihydroxy-2-butanone-4-phosphate synthase [Burkholderiales bacterium]
MKREPAAVSPIAEIIAEIRAGNIVILVDDEDRENEGDLVFAAELRHARKAINFLARIRPRPHLSCRSPPSTPRAARAAARWWPTTSSPSRHRPSPSPSRRPKGVTTGISAHDRAPHHHRSPPPRTRRPRDIVQPGHVFPLARPGPGGVLVRAGHTEAGCDLARPRWDWTPAAVLCEILKDDGSDGAPAGPARLRQARHGLKIGTIADLIHYRSAPTRALVRTPRRAAARPPRCGRIRPRRLPRSHRGQARPILRP